MTMEPRPSHRESSAGSRPNGQGHRDASAPPLPETHSGDTLVKDAVSLLDGVVDYLASIFRLERYRFEVRTRRLLQKAVFLASGAAVLMIGLVFASVGVSSLLSQSLQAPYAGPLIVGGFYLVVGMITLMIAARKREI